MDKAIVYKFKLPELKYVFLFGLIPLIFLIISKSLYIQVQTLSVCLGCLIYVKENNKKLLGFKFDFLIFSLKYLLFSGTLIGVYYLIIGYNDLFKFIQYSFLSFSFLYCYKAGSRVPKLELINFAFFLFLCEVFLLFVLLAKGFEARTSIGASNLFPLALILILNKSVISNKTFLLVLLGLILYLLIALTSGMRSVIGVSFFSVLVISFRHFLFFLKKMIKTTSLLIILFFSLSFVIPEKLTNVVFSRVESVKKRFESTIFNNDGIRYDADDTEGRKLEAKSALETFLSRDIAFTYFFGYGNGYYYFDKMQHKMKTHMHITSYAFFTRFGLIGLLIYSMFFLLIIVKGSKYFFRKGFENDVFFALYLSSFQILFISFFAASLTFVINWIIFGLARNHTEL